MTDPLAALARAAHRRRTAETTYYTALTAALEAGRTYSDVARAAGVSRQSVRVYWINALNAAIERDEALRLNHNAEGTMPRTILVHLNIELPDADGGPSADELADLILAQIRVEGAEIVCPLAEEV